MHYSIRWDLRLAVVGDDAGEASIEIEQQVGVVMEELVKLEGCDERITDPAVSLDLSRNVIETELVIEAGSLAEAVAIGESTVRTAIHAAGGYTTNWESTSVDDGSVEYELLNFRAEPTAV